MFFLAWKFPLHITKTLIREGDGTMQEKGMFGGFDPTMMIEDFMKLLRFSFDVAFGNVMKLQDFNMKMLKESTVFGPIMRRLGQAAPDKLGGIEIAAMRALQGVHVVARSGRCLYGPGAFSMRRFPVSSPQPSQRDRETVLQAPCSFPSVSLSSSSRHSGRS